MNRDVQFQRQGQALEGLQGDGLKRIEMNFFRTSMSPVKCARDGATITKRCR